METRLYNEFYSSNVCENIGAMFEYASYNEYLCLLFWKFFIGSEVANQIEERNPKYIAGYSGKDYYKLVLEEKGKSKINKIKKDQLLMYNKYYWAGWAIAKFQYATDYSFMYIDKYLPIEKVLELYNPLHEADISKFIEVAKTYFKETQKETNLKRIRNARGLSQSKLANESGVDIRSIQMYEQRNNNINKAQVDTIYKLSKVLCCKMEDLLEKRL